MRPVLAGCVAVLAACASSAGIGPATSPPSAPAAAPPGTISPPSGPPRRSERLAADTPMTTVAGASFVAPAGWSVGVRGQATILEAPEADSRIALVDVRAESADAAVAAAWAAYQPETRWPLKVVTDAPDRDGWSDRRAYVYQVSPNEKRDVAAYTRRAGDTWTVILYDVTQAVGEKRLAAVELVFGRLFPRGYSRESFAGKRARVLDPARVARITDWLQTAMRELRVPGAALGLVQDGKVIFADGFGVRELGRDERPDADTLFMIASNTKALTTLLLAKLVDEERIAWDTPVTSVLPSFALGDPEITRQLCVKHLVCACTGLPRQDLEWLFQFQGVTSEGAMATLATMTPTSRFGEMFQYSNLLAGAGGFVAGHVLFPDMELGKAYDEAMRARVFEPLGMNATTFDYARALRGNHALPHAPDVDGRPSRAVMEVNYAVVPLRPAGGAWSSVRDLLRYVSAELAEGVLPGGQRYISRATLLERRVRQVNVGSDVTYGMGLMVDTEYGVPVVHHGGDMIGFHSDMLWLPEHGVGAVVLTNGDPGGLPDLFLRKLLEVLFDGRPEADARLIAGANAFFAQIEADRKLLTVPADAAEARNLARRYANDALGGIAVVTSGGVTTFDFGEWRSEMASRRNPDGTVSFVTIAPGMIGVEFVVGEGKQRTLVTRDAQHEYVFTAR